MHHAENKNGSTKNIYDLPAVSPRPTMTRAPPVPPPLRLKSNASFNRMSLATAKRERLPSTKLAPDPGKPPDQNHEGRRVGLYAGYVGRTLLTCFFAGQIGCDLLGRVAEAIGGSQRKLL